MAKSKEYDKILDEMEQMAGDMLDELDANVRGEEITKKEAIEIAKKIEMMFYKPEEFYF
jgi:hypothetical protein